ncbi:MAG: histidine triad nucleotide-binding protein [Clostridia bacterium]|jgi:histidine triad (HIT) family protein
MEECIFCKIAGKDIPSDCVYEDDQVFAFRDINPQAPVHILVIPKQHFGSLLEVTEKTSSLVANVVMTVNKLAKQLNLDESGFRLVVNTGKDGGQTVDHLHFHLLGGRELGWPPG